MVRLSHVGGLSSIQKKAYLHYWYAASVDAGIPFCEYLRKLTNEAVAISMEDGDRLIGSTSNAGQTITYAPSKDQPNDPGSMTEFLAECAEACPLCDVPDPATEEDFLNCLLASIQSERMAFQKSSLGIRL